MTRMFVLLLFCTYACATPQTTLNSAVPAKASKLDKEFLVVARMGSLPIKLTDKDKVLRYALYPQGRSADYVIIVSPKHADGEIKLPIKEAGGTVESAYRYNRYIDLLLRSHRHLLRGELKESEKILDQVDKEWDVTFGSLIMRANIALVVGDERRAQRYFNRAQNVYPKASIVKRFIKR